jgi:hypothetical protein
LRHIAETIDAVMIAEGIEHVEDVVALRDLGIRYGQGYYMARPGPPFPTLPDAVRAELRAAGQQPSSKPAIPIQVHQSDDHEEDEDDDLPIAMAQGSLTAVPRNVFGRPEDEITSDFATPPDARRPRASEPPDTTEPLPQLWQPLSDDEATGEALLSSLKKPGDPENAAGSKPGSGGPGLN